MYYISTKYSSLLDLTSAIVRRPRPQNTVIICCFDRDEFMDQLRTAVEGNMHAAPSPPPQPASHKDEIPASQELLEVEDEDISDHNDSPEFTLLIPTMHLLATSQNVRVVFCPTVATLRAYIGTYTCTPSPSSSSERPPSLVVVDMLQLHHGTSEFTVLPNCFRSRMQLGRAYRTESSLHMVECRDVRDPTHPNRGPALWDTQVPLLSGSIKLRGAGQSWAGRMVVVKKFAGRWFREEDEGL